MTERRDPDACLSRSLENRNRLLHGDFPVVYRDGYHRLLILPSNSSLKLSRKLWTTTAAWSPRGQKVLPAMFADTSRRRLRSSSRPMPLHILTRIAVIHPTPSLQGVHFPHDSCSKNSLILRHTLTRSTVSSKTMTAPEPSILRSEE